MQVFVIFRTIKEMEGLEFSVTVAGPTGMPVRDQVKS